MSAFYDLASLVVVPSGYKSGKVYAQKPLTTDGQLAFTRASTATRVNASGLIETVASGVPRLDYLNSTCPKLLLEPQRTNYVRNNTTLIDWLETEPTDTISTTAGTSPDGTNNAIKVIPSTVSVGHQFYDGLTSQASGGNFVMSCYAKAGGLTKFALRESQSIGYYATFNLSNGTVIEAGSSVTASIQSVGNGWYRCVAVVTGSNPVCIGLLPLPSGYTAGDPIGYAYAGNGTDGVLVYQPQLEVSATYATSPISTAGVASATRVADAASKTGISSLIGQTEGVVFIDLNYTPHSVNFETSISLQGTTTAQYMEAYFSSSNVLNFGIYNSGAQLVFSTAAQAAGRKKIAIAYKANDFAIYLNGAQIHTDNSGSVPALSSLGLGADFASSLYQVSQPINQALLFTTRLTNAQLSELTAL
jgi:hypothetical protein